MSQAIEDVEIELTVVLGQTMMPIRQLLKLGRGAVIDLDGDQDQPVKIYANGELIAKGEIVVSGDNIAISITRSVKTYQM
ncbi:FliM/FliN family flagellar motor switch protein [Luteithermobacter gelatinilyticus]|uniref:FliM/FliN family flagellar motor switch protein n=1 Tax=Luteithermobacter gelatinilyticus TaxID=2582913 RepID=UPI001105C630|nr:FliM/FliN family flagellar motor switch protein [Luteithermobacter gelatinilyticus]|tara:strand:+ start:892 stop:1131 length:240 start_codon:yes stop_codon:yes gene_type:complete